MLEWRVPKVVEVVWIDILFFFLQAEDGIRDRNVTGVQTCALPISSWGRAPDPEINAPGLARPIAVIAAIVWSMPGVTSVWPPTISTRRPSAVWPASRMRSEERRVGKGGRSGGWAGHETRNEHVSRH